MKPTLNVVANGHSACVKHLNHSFLAPITRLKKKDIFKSHTITSLRTKKFLTSKIENET